jgi:hypothetical protein
MKDLEKTKTKKELVDIIEQLQAKLVEMRGVEAKADSLESNLPGKGFSIIQDLEGKFQLVKIAFDFDTKAATIVGTEEIYPSNYDFSLYQAKKHLVEVVMNKDNLNHLKETKNG